MLKIAVLAAAAIAGSVAAQSNNFPEYNSTYYDYTWGRTDIPLGSAVWSGIPSLPAHLRRKFKLVPHNETNEVFINTLKSVKNHPALDDYTFGDWGFDNLGFGGIGNFDIFTLKETTTFSVFGQYYVSKDDNTTSCDSSNAPNLVADCDLLPYSEGYGAWEQPWWSLPGDSHNLTVIESKNQVSQICWEQGMDQTMLCEFEEGTHVMVGKGLWRNTQGPLNDGNPCDKNLTDGQEWDHPQKAISEHVYQYLIPMGHNDQGASPVNVKKGSCYICPNKGTVDGTIENYKENCWKREDPDDVFAAVSAFTSYADAGRGRGERGGRARRHQPRAKQTTKNANLRGTQMTTIKSS